MPVNQIDDRDVQQVTSNSAAESCRVMLFLMLAYVPMDLFLPCACVLRQYDPRPYMLLLITGAWIYHLICCKCENKFTLLRRDILLGILFLLIAFFTMPM